MPLNKLLEHYKALCPYHEARCTQLQCACIKYQAYEATQQPGAIDAVVRELGVDPTLDPLSLMLTLQAGFAQRFHPTQGLSKIEVDRWLDDYKGCIMDELGEVRSLLNYLPWEPRDSGALSTLQGEVIDIWHFVMDMLLVGGLQDGRAVWEHYRHHRVTSLLELEPSAWLPYILQHERDFLAEHKLAFTPTDVPTLEWSVLFIQATLQDALYHLSKCYDWKHWKKPREQLDMPTLRSALVELLVAFFRLAVLVGLDSASLTDAYLHKNVENVWRQRLAY